MQSKHRNSELDENVQAYDVSWDETKTAFSWCVILKIWKNIQAGDPLTALNAYKIRIFNGIKYKLKKLLLHTNFI